MNRNTKIVLVLLSISFLVIPIGIAASFPAELRPAVDTSLTSADYDFSNRNSPINILMYIEKTDVSAGGEFENVYNSILETYGQAFQYENLTDYTELASRVFEFDIFMILEQEVHDDNFTIIGSSWAGTLTDYVSSGGIVIATEGGQSVSDCGAKIMNATGLIKTFNPEKINPDPVTIADAYDPLAFNVTGFNSPNAAFAYDIEDAIPVIEHVASSKTFVAHRQLGMGHAVLIGCDYYERNPSVDMILANAIRLTRLAVFDNTHDQQDNPIGSMYDFAKALTTQGFAIQTMNVWDPALISRCNVFIVGNTWTSSDPYNTTEIDAVDDFVASGGGLFLMIDYYVYGNITDPLANRFGYVRNYSSSYFGDSDDNDGNPLQPTFDSGNIANHSTAIGAYTIQLFGSTVFETIPEGATPIIWSDSDGTATVGGDNKSGLALAAASHHGNGRVFAIADGDWAHDTYFVNHNDYDFAISIAIWLSAAGIPEKTVLIEGSNSPYHSYASLTHLSRFLSLNGFNVRWETTFSEQYIHEADVLLIISGVFNYTKERTEIIQNYVVGGGSLFVLCDWTGYQVMTNNITAPWGMKVNGTTYLSDSDDGGGAGLSQIIYNGTNLANHPILNGVHTIYVDRGPGFSSIGSGTALVSTDEDGTCTWYAGGVANGVPVIAANAIDKGRVVVLPDLNFFDASDGDGDGYWMLYDYDNDIFTTNAFFWLVENRAPSVEVLTPNGGEILNGTIMVEWDAIDFDGDSLTFDVLYSDDNGASWDDLAIGLLVDSYSWNTTLYPDGSGYMIRVIVSDGMATAQDDSDSPFELDNIEETTTTTTTPSPTTTTSSPTTSTDTNTTTTTTPTPLDATLIIIIAAAGVVIVIIIIIIVKKK